jgi:flagellar motor switch protein FliM
MSDSRHGGRLKLKDVCSTIQQRAHRSGTETGDHPPPKRYVRHDFRAPRRLGTPILRGLERLTARMAERAQAALHDGLGDGVKVRPLQVQQSAYGRYLEHLKMPSLLCILSAQDLAGQIAMEIGRPLGYAMLERLMGAPAGAKPFVPARAPTEIECRLLHSIAESLVRQIASAWEPMRRLAIECCQTDPAALRIVPLKEIVAIAPLEVRLNDFVGRLTFCLPHGAVEAMVEPEEPATGNAEQSAWLRANLADVVVELTAVLPQTALSMQDLASLEVGDTITTGAPVAGGVGVCVEGIQKLAADLVQIGGRRALRLHATRTGQPEAH